VLASGVAAALRIGDVHKLSPASVMVRDAINDDGLVAIAVGVESTLFDCKREATTSIIETKDEHVVSLILG